MGFRKSNWIKNMTLLNLFIRQSHILFLLLLLSAVCVHSQNIQNEESGSVEVNRQLISEKNLKEGNTIANFTKIYIVEGTLTHNLSENISADIVYVKKKKQEVKEEKQFIVEKKKPTPKTKLPDKKIEEEHLVIITLDNQTKSELSALGGRTVAVAGGHHYFKQLGVSRLIDLNLCIYPFEQLSNVFLPQIHLPGNLTPADFIRPPPVVVSKFS